MMSFMRQSSLAKHNDLAGTDHFVSGPTLSTDYLNHFAEALMLIEAMSFDDKVVAELAEWRPLSYRAHFAKSALRCAQPALQAYDALSHDSRGAFESLCSAMDRLVETVRLTLAEVDDPASSLAILRIAAQAFRNLLCRATEFINTGGDLHKAAYDEGELQQVIDRLMRA